MTQPIAPAVALKVPTYATRTPYITIEEYQTSATGVDSSTLIPDGSAAQNLAALQVLIGRASSWADSLCNVAALAATLDIQGSPSIGWRVFRDGTIRVPLDITPVIAVTGVSVGYTPSTMRPLTSLVDVWIGEKVATIPVSGANLFSSNGGYLGGYLGGFRTGDRLVGAVSYVNGWANTLLTGASAAGVTTLTVADGTGIFAGLRMSIYDFASAEVVTVASTYVFGSTTVPLAAPAQYAHDPLTSISAFPPAIKQAVISLTSCLIRTRGAASFGMNSVAEMITDGEMQSGGFTDLEIATDLLAQYTRVV